MNNEEFKGFVICKKVNLQGATEEDFACIVPELFFEKFEGKFDVKATIWDDGKEVQIIYPDGKVVKIPDNQVNAVLNVLDNAFHLYAVAYAVAKRGTRLYYRINTARGIIAGSLLREKHVMIPDAEEPFDVILL